jgi:hypothetical protein
MLVRGCWLAEEKRRTAVCLFYGTVGRWFLAIRLLVERLFCAAFCGYARTCSNGFVDLHLLFVCALLQNCCVFDITLERGLVIACVAVHLLLPFTGVTVLLTCAVVSYSYPFCAAFTMVLRYYAEEDVRCSWEGRMVEPLVAAAWPVLADSLPSLFCWLPAATVCLCTAGPAEARLNHYLSSCLPSTFFFFFFFSRNSVWQKAAKINCQHAARVYVGSNYLHPLC